MQTNHRNGRPAFSLIEMMAVVTIIVVLAGLVVGAMGFVSEKEAKSKAQVQIQLIAKSLEEYKLDFGSYPATTNSPKGEDNSKFLFKALYWDSDNDGQGIGEGNAVGDADQKIYLAELDPATTKQGWTSGKASASTRIYDPWGKEYRYRSGADSQGKSNSNTQNPDFDLWSAGKDGKTNPTTPADKTNRDDIKNF